MFQTHSCSFRLLAALLRHMAKGMLKDTNGQTGARITKITPIATIMFRSTIQTGQPIFHCTRRGSIHMFPNTSQQSHDGCKVFAPAPFMADTMTPSFDQAIRQNLANWIKHLFLKCRRFGADTFHGRHSSFEMWCGLSHPLHRQMEPSAIFVFFTKHAALGETPALRRWGERYPKNGWNPAPDLL